MARSVKPKAIAMIAGQRAEDAMWGIPESPEFSSVQRLMIEVQSHAAREEQALSSYREIARETSDAKIRFLLGLMIADEERHHELMARMISKLKDELAWTRSTGVRRGAGESGEGAKRLLVSIESFLAGERKAMEDYTRLKKESRGLYRDMFALLYTTMIHDSHKHVDILTFLRAKLKQDRHNPRRRQA
jgi:rubrerythrin